MLFNRFSVVCSIVSLVSALILDTPSSQWYSGEDVIVTWQEQPTGDPVFTLVLASSVSPIGLAIASDISPALGSLAITVPDVQPGSYVLEAVNVTNNSDIYAETALFKIL
ncbi:uncharacterized protein FIBRA_06966 [Fibroporia radiculosa]|uniref:Yeast cell wall synthesis Kre9/Knh1-like N-terminal domain-containing protein n=1 Tax=Fibroporia radiculosa TaxID=599839 RepID=J4GU03_9APHY|nr:uncharacterized protein FIBRA_06966 [Fibroporia radiculosa]CCM04775.1 predicted protein [Fibroporia radiculosa]